MGLCGLASTPEAKAGPSLITTNSSPSKNRHFRRRTPEHAVFRVTKANLGKTSLLNVFTQGFFPEVYEPTVFENCTSIPRPNDLELLSFTRLP
jgi:hypothetical protein